MLLAIVIYRCEVEGVPTGSLDIQVRRFAGSSESDVEARLRAEPPVSYSNDVGETVTWPLSHIAAIGELTDTADGRELVGFIAGAEDFVAWSQQGT